MMKGIKDIIVKGSIFAVLLAVFCMGGTGRGLETAWAATEITWETTEWKGEMALTNGYVAFNHRVELSDDTTLKVDGESLYFSYGIDCKGHTLTIDGTGIVSTAGNVIDSQAYSGISGKVILKSGKLIVRGSDGSNNGDGAPGIEGNVTINGGTLVAYGGSCGYQANGGAGITGSVSLNGGELEAIGGGGNYGTAGNGIQGDVTLNGGTLKVAGGTGDTPGVAFGSDVVIAEGKAYTVDGTRLFRGTLSEDEKNTIAGQTIVPYIEASIGENSYPTIQEALDAATAENHTVTLLKDVQTTSPLTVSKNIILDLNGHTIDRGLKGKAAETNGYVIKIEESGNLTLTDNSTAKTGLITGGNTTPSGGGIYVDENAEFIMEGGTISGNTAYSTGGGVCIIGSKFTVSGGKIADNNVTSSGGYGGGVHVTLSEGNDGLTVTRSTFNMSGGEIKGNTAESNSNAGGVSVIGSSFTMTGGKIANNVTNNGYGGGVFVSLGSDKNNNKIPGSFEISGGEIERNTANNVYGGGVYVDEGCSLTMSGGIINSNTAGFGGGVYVCKGSSLTMSDGEINSNIAKSASGGGVYVGDRGSLVMSGGKINGNKAANYGGGVYVYFGSRATMSGGEIKNNTAGVCGGGIFSNSTFEISGAPEINGNIVNDKKDNVCLFKENTYSLITVTGALANKAHIGVCIWEENDTNDYIYNDLEFAEPGNNYTLTPADVSHFICDDDAYAPILNERSKAKFVIGYKVKVEDGTGSGTYAEGVSVTIKANAPEKGKRFKEWKGTDGLTFTSGSATTAEATFTMPAQAVTVEAFYEDIPKVKAPAFSPEGGTYTSPQNVIISSETPDAVIYYTTNGSTPTESRTQYTRPVSVTETTTIKAIAVKEGMLNSEVSSATYTINSVPPEAKYHVTVENGSGDDDYKAGAIVTITADAPAEGKVFDRWTGDGVAFTNASSETTTFTMPARAVTVKATYRNKDTVAAPVFNPDGGNYTVEQNVTISCPAEGAVIYYTLNGSDPTTDSIRYSAPISVTEDMTIKAFAVKDGMNNSAVSTAIYTIGEEPVITKFLVTVNYGTGDGEYEENDTVTIKANDPPEGKVFDKWTSEDGVTFADAASPETSFTMPAKKVTVSATYKDKGKKEDDPDPNPDPDPDPDPNPSPNPDPDPNPDPNPSPDPDPNPDPNPSPDPGPNPDPAPNPSPEKPVPEKIPEKVPVSDPASAYASPEDNFAPVAPGSSEGTGGSIKKLELDFSKVKGSGVATDSLKMTAIAGSKFTTRAKVKDKNSVHTEGGVKAKFNKKDGTATITCKKDGNATFETEEGTFKVEFKVDKPKPNKNEAKISTGTAPVTKTVKDLFGTSINGGKLTILKEKVNGQATLKGNELTVNPAEKDTIKLQYQYLNKKYKLSLKVK